MGRAGFTLVEMLVVIAILSVLALTASSMFTSTERARDAAARVCAQELLRHAAMHHLHEGTYATFTGTGEGDPGMSCARGQQVEDWGFYDRAERRIVGGVQSRSRRGTVYYWSIDGGNHQLGPTMPGGG